MESVRRIFTFTLLQYNIHAEGNVCRNFLFVTNLERMVNIIIIISAMGGYHNSPDILIMPIHRHVKPLFYRSIFYDNYKIFEYLRYQKPNRLDGNSFHNCIAFKRILPENLLKFFTFLCVEQKEHGRRKEWEKGRKWKTDNVLHFVDGSMGLRSTIYDYR